MPEANKAYFGVKNMCRTGSITPVVAQGASAGSFWRQVPAVPHAPAQPGLQPPPKLCTTLKLGMWEQKREFCMAWSWRLKMFCQAEMLMPVLLPESPPAAGDQGLSRGQGTRTRSGKEDTAARWQLSVWRLRAGHALGFRVSFFFFNFLFIG